MRKHGRNGSALLTVIILVLIASAFVATLAGASISRTFMAKKLAERLKAVAIAEGGVSKAYSVLAADFDKRTNAAAFPVTAYGGGTYDVSVAPVGADGASICSTGVYGSVTEVAMLDVKMSSVPGGGGGGGGPAYDYSIIAGGTINWTGASVFSGGGGAHCNGQFTRSGSGDLESDVSSSTGYHSNGNAGGIKGDVTAPVLSGNLSKITGAKTTASVPLVGIPDIDLTPYYNAALANGEVRSGNVTLSGNYTPNGGILWVNGSLSIAGNATFNGCFIATGNLSVSGGGAINNATTYPTLVSRDGDISFTGGKAVTGLIYVKMGDYSQAGGNNLTGQIIVRGDVSKSGSSTVINYADSEPTPPGGGGGGGEGSLGVTAWQR